MSYFNFEKLSQSFLDEADKQYKSRISYYEYLQIKLPELLETVAKHAERNAYMNCANKLQSSAECSKRMQEILEWCHNKAYPKQDDVK